MTTHDAPDVAALPAEPPSEVEWEDLLLRVEVAPRALRLAVDHGPAGGAGVRDALQRAFQWEVRLQSALSAMAGAGTSAEDAENAAGGGLAPADALAAIARLRARSFAMVQRRGLEVWRWRAAGGPFDGATAYQLLSATLEHDRRTMAAVRASAREG